MKYEVVVGNIGRVYNGDVEARALIIYDTYVSQSRRRQGRAAGESVVIIADGDIIKEHVGEDNEVSD